MARTRIIIACAVGFASMLAACGGGTSAPPHPDAPDVDAYFSNCGHPGDPGNEMGIGMFCASICRLLDDHGGAAVLEPRRPDHPLLHQDLLEHRLHDPVRDRRRVHVQRQQSVRLYAVGLSELRNRKEPP